MEAEKAPEKIDLISYVNRFFKMLQKFWIYVLILAVLGAGLNYIRERRGFWPYYESKVIFSVRSGYAGDDVFTNPYYYDTAAASQLAESFPNMLNTDIMKDLVLAKLGKSYINGTIIPSNIADTNLFELTVRSGDAQDAYDILCAVIESYPQVMVYSLDNPQLIIRHNPTLPEEPVNSFNHVDPLVKGGILGLGLGLMLVAGLALIAKAVGSADELKKLVNLPLLASFPHVVLKKRRNKVHTFINPEDDEGLAEALRGLRTKVRKQLAEKNGKVILLTSTLPGEGKSTIAANLALTLEKEGNRVMLVDADLRNQSIFRMFSSGKPRAGLMECLRTAKVDPLKVMNRVKDLELYYLSGVSTTNRHYSVDSKAMNRVMEILLPEFDYIILDSPPCSIVSDTALLARHADTVLYVVKQDYATQSQILDGVMSLYDRDLPVTGCILNDVPRSRIRYGYSYGYGYGSYGYGYGYGKKYGYGSKKK